MLDTAFQLPPEQALAFFRSRGLATTFDWRDLQAEENALSFTVAKMADRDLLATVREALDQALADGLSLGEFKRNLIPTLQGAGWWGRKVVTDPLTRETTTAQLGSPWRLETIFRTNLQTAYAVGQWEEIEQAKETHPYLLYDAVDDGRTRPQHRAWDGTVLPAGHPWWNSHMPPNGWNCRCGVIPVSEDQLRALGKSGPDPAPDDGAREWENPRTGEARRVPNGVDPGFDYNPGKLRVEHLARTWLEKTADGPVQREAEAALALLALLATPATAEGQTLLDLLADPATPAMGVLALLALVLSLVRAGQ